MKKILCIGNRFAYPDNFGIKVYEHLKANPPEGVEIIEGGVGGLSLALHFETDAPILVVDHGVGFSKHFFPLKELPLDHICGYDHDSAFYYLLKTLDKPDIWLYVSNDPYWKKEELQKRCNEIVQRIKQL